MGISTNINSATNMHQKNANNAVKPINQLLHLLGKEMQPCYNQSNQPNQTNEPCNRINSKVREEKQEIEENSYTLLPSFPAFQASRPLQQQCLLLQ